MSLHKASRPAPVKIDFFSSGFYGETCPICQENRLGVNLCYPICVRCRQKYDLTEDLLEALRAHRLMIDQEVVDWLQKPHPEITGTIDQIRWKAQFVLGQWLIQVQKQTKDRTTIAKLIREYLTKLTPEFVDRLTQKQTKIRRYAFFIATGATLITLSYVIKKWTEKKTKEQQEAEEAEGQKEHKR